MKTMSTVVPYANKRTTIRYTVHPKEIRERQKKRRQADIRTFFCTDIQIFKKEDELNKISTQKDYIKIKYVTKKIKVPNKIRENTVENEF